MIFRVAAALIFTAVGAVIGFSLADRLRDDRKSCGAVGHLFQRAAFLIGSRCEDVYGVCRDMKKDEELKRLGFIQSLPNYYIAGEDFHRLWNNALDNEQNIGKEEKELLYRFGAMLGRSDKDAQLLEIRSLMSELEAVSGMRRDALVKKGRLYRAAGLLFGVMAGILVL
ncbi:MAG: stage III sporulation protein AB [Ruminococcus sp.]|nr:stage III sporulation protein AB [Ruminococcus sp.]